MKKEEVNRVMAENMANAIAEKNEKIKTEKRKDSQTYALKQVADMAKKFKENDWITKEQFQHLKEIHNHLTQKFIGGNVFDE